MRWLLLILLGVFVATMPIIPAATQSANAQFIDPEEMFEDNPARFDEAIEEGKTIVPDISALDVRR